MTTPIIPDFILKLFQGEVDKIVQKEIQKVCELYHLNYEEVKTKLGHVELKTTETNGFRIMKKNETFAPSEIRCMARMLHDLEIKQCSKRRSVGAYCKKHAKHNKYGNINDPIPDELRPEVLNEKKKSKIY